MYKRQTYAYNRGWTSIETAIKGAAEFVSLNYVHSSRDVYKRQIQRLMKVLKKLHKIN